MNSTLFEEPVTVLVGLGFPRKIGSAIEAYQLLSDMRLMTSKAAHKMTMQACRAAIDGKIDPQIARAAFVAFASRIGMLLANDTARLNEPVRPQPLTYDKASRVHQAHSRDALNAGSNENRPHERTTHAPA